MRPSRLVLITCGLIAAPAAASATEVTYTDTHGAHCRQSVAHTELSTYTCRGPAGRSLTVVDAVMSGGITYGRGPQAEAWQPGTRITGDGIGKKVEWRSLAGVPYAAIHRMHTPGGSVLVVTKLSAAGGCHAGYVDGAQPGANARASALADSARDSFRCGVDRAATIGRRLYDAAT